MSIKQDRQGARTVTDLERKYSFGKSFSEVLGVALDAQTHAAQAEEGVKDLTLKYNELSVLVGNADSGIIGKLEAKLDTDKLVSQFNLSFNEITIKSDNFELTADGEITATSGFMGGWDIADDTLYAKEDIYETETNSSGITAGWSGTNESWAKPNYIGSKTQYDYYENILSPVPSYKVIQETYIEDGYLRIRNNMGNMLFFVENLSDDGTMVNRRMRIRISREPDGTGQYPVYAEVI